MSCISSINTWYWYLCRAYLYIAACMVPGTAMYYVSLYAVSSDDFERGEAPVTAKRVVSHSG